jgi:hypothetical protein
MHYYDRYLHHKYADNLSLTSNNEIDKVLQLLALTAIYVACKNEGCKCSLAQFVKLGSGQFTQESIKKMEIELMFSLHWLLNPPLPQDFSEFYIFQLSKYITQAQTEMQAKVQDPLWHSQTLQVVDEVSTYIIEILVQYDEFKYENASVIGCAVILLSFQDIKSSIMSSKYQEQIRVLFLKSLSSTFTNINTTSSSPSSTTSIEKILSIQDKMKSILCSNFYYIEDIKSKIDPDGLIYDSFIDPPVLL